MTADQQLVPNALEPLMIGQYWIRQGRVLIRSESATVRFARPITAAAGVYAPGHIGELTQYLPFELVDDVLSETKTVQRRPMSLA